MTPLDKIKAELALFVYEKLDAAYPRYRNMPEPRLGWELESAAVIGAIRWALKCHEGNQSKAAKRCGINRNTLRRFLNDAKMMEEIAKYDAVEQAILAKTVKDWPLDEISPPRQRI